MATQTYRIGRLTLRARRELVGPCGPVALGGRALDLLSTLAEAGGALVTKDDLFATVWASSIVEEGALQAQVSAARKALGEEGRRLVTVHGRGYRLDLDTWEAALTVEPDQASIAVLPFENRTGSAEHAYLADGLAEELISRLARVSGLKIPARTSSFAYRGRATDIRTIATELGVATVLEGSVRADGERLRVGVQLIDAGSGFTIWSESFDRTMTDLLTLQDELAEAIAAALLPGLQIPRPRTDSAEAMELVLRARSISARLTRQAMEEADRLTHEALAIDPEFASAWEARAGILDWGVNVGVLPIDRRAEALDCARRAVALDPHLPEACGIIGSILAFGGDWLGAQAQFRHALAVPNCSPVLREHLALHVLIPAGHLARAAAMADEAIHFAPARFQSSQIAAVCALIAGRQEQASTLLDTAVFLGFPDFRPPFAVIRSSLAEAEGRYEEAGLAMGKMLARELDDPDACDAAVSATLAAATGTGRDEAISKLHAVLDRTLQSGSIWRFAAHPGSFMVYFAKLGVLDDAYSVAETILRRWRDQGILATFALNAMWGTPMKCFREDPRFQELVRELNMFEYWQRHGPPDGHRLENDKLVVL